MGHLVYDVAASLDGYIAGPGGDISAFPHDGDHVDAYRERLARYDTVVMGRHTYEFGYAYGLRPGQLAYPHMRHVVFSASIELPADSDVRIAHLRHASQSDSSRSGVSEARGPPYCIQGA